MCSVSAAHACVSAVVMATLGLKDAGCMRPSDCVPLCALGPAGMLEARHVEAYRDVCCVETVYTTLALQPCTMGVWQIVV